MKLQLLANVNIKASFVTVKDIEKVSDTLERVNREKDEMLSLIANAEAEIRDIRILQTKYDLGIN